MHIPKQFRNEDISSVRDFIAGNGFAVLVSQVAGRPWATHIPLQLHTDATGKDILEGHISRANQQWKSFDNGQEVLAIFQGPHAYISSSWYDHENVPTWNYLAVHVYGKINIISEEALRQQLSRLVDKYESRVTNPVSVAGLSKDFLDKEIRGVVGFDLEITEIQAAAKLSQNRDDKNRQNIIDGLTTLGDPDSLTMADILKHPK